MTGIHGHHAVELVFHMRGCESRLAVKHWHTACTCGWVRVDPEGTSSEVLRLRAEKHSAEHDAAWRPWMASWREFADE